MAGAGRKPAAGAAAPPPEPSQDLPRVGPYFSQPDGRSPTHRCSSKCAAAGEGEREHWALNEMKAWPEPSAEADSYSFGMVIYETIARRVPFAVKSCFGSFPGGS